MNAVVMQAELALEAILAEHDDLLDQARGFGMRMASFPRGLMPLKEAQDIVAKFDANTIKLKEFLTSLADARYRAPDKGTKDALDKIGKKGTEALRKFEDDLKKAQDALVKHEDLLVGENFQEMFQALRLAVLDLDLTVNAAIGAKTSLYLDATPAYAVGLVTVIRRDPKEDAYKVRATYKAETDEYLADMWSQKSNRWFPAAKKSGHARIPAFVKAVADKLKAVHDLEGENLIGSRRTVVDTSKEVSGYRGELEEKKRKALMENGYQEATRKIVDISQAIDRKLRQRFPQGRTQSHRVERKDVLHAVITWNTVTVGDTTVQLATSLTVNYWNGEVSRDVSGHYGLINGASLSLPVQANTPQQYIDAAVEALSLFAIPSPAVTRALTRKIEDVASQVLTTLSKLPGYRLEGNETHVANGVVLKKYKFQVKDRNNYYNEVGLFDIQISSGDRFFQVTVKPFGASESVHKRYSPSAAAEQIVGVLLAQRPDLRASRTTPAAPTPTPAPTPAPAPSGGSGVTPHIRAVLRELRGLRIGYPGTLGAAAETEINKVLTGAVPSVTLSASKLVPVADTMQSDVAAVRDLARKVQDQFKNGTAQVGNVTITQKVTLKYRAQVVNLLLTIPSKDARPPGPTNPSVDLAGSVGEYFARGSKGALPAKVTSFIAAVELTISRQDGVARTAGTTRTAGATTFENMVWIADVRDAFRHNREEELETHGHREGYPGTIAAKSSYTVRAKEPMTEEAAYKFVRKDINNNNKWDSDAFAVPVTDERVLATNKVTVTVTARDEKEALRQAQMRIFATGRFPPNTGALVDDVVSKKISETARTVTLEVTGTRKLVRHGTTDGWMFYGWAPE